MRRVEIDEDQLPFYMKQVLQAARDRAAKGDDDTEGTVFGQLASKLCCMSPLRAQGCQSAMTQKARSQCSAGRL